MLIVHSFPSSRFVYSSFLELLVIACNCWRIYVHCVSPYTLHANDSRPILRDPVLHSARSGHVRLSHHIEKFLYQIFHWITKVYLLLFTYLNIHKLWWLTIFLPSINTSLFWTYKIIVTSTNISRDNNSMFVHFRHQCNLFVMFLLINISCRRSLNT